MELYFVVRPPIRVFIAQTSLGWIGWQSVEKKYVFFYAASLVYSAGDLFLIVLLPGMVSYLFSLDIF